MLELAGQSLFLFIFILFNQHFGQKSLDFGGIQARIARIIKCKHSWLYVKSPRLDYQ